jgi:hypothetical protein
MRKVALSPWVLFLGLTAGCGGGMPDLSNSGEPPPHGGTLKSLPGGTELVEIVKKDTPASQKSVTSEVSFYFFKNAYTPLSRNPSSGMLTLVNKKKVELKAEGDGTLTVQLDGKTRTIPLGDR